MNFSSGLDLSRIVVGGTLASEPLDNLSLVSPLFVEVFELRLDEHDERGRLNASEVAAG